MRQPAQFPEMTDKSETIYPLDKQSFPLFLHFGRSRAFCFDDAVRVSESR